jgi:hypothetical protein
VKRSGSPGEGCEVRHAADRHQVEDLDEAMLLDLPAPAAPRAIGRLTPALLRVDQDEVDLQEWVCQETCDADELGEGIARPAVARRASPTSTESSLPSLTIHVSTAMVDDPQAVSTRQ